MHAAEIKAQTTKFKFKIQKLLALSYLRSRTLQNNERSVITYNFTWNAAFESLSPHPTHINNPSAEANRMC